MNFMVNLYKSISEFFSNTCIIKTSLIDSWIPFWKTILIAENIGLISLDGCPDHIVELRLSHNKLTSFYGFPSKVKRIDMTHNLFTNLIGCPSNVTHLRVSNNPLKSLIGCPSNLISLECSYTHIKNFQGINFSIKSIVACFTFLEDCSELPNNMDKLYVSYNNIRTCHNIPNVKYLDLSCNLITSLNGLPLLGIEELCVSNNFIDMININKKSSIKKLRICNNPINNIISLPRKLILFQARKTRLTSCAYIEKFCDNLQECLI